MVLWCTQQVRICLFVSDVNVCGWILSNLAYMHTSGCVTCAKNVLQMYIHVLSNITLWYITPHSLKFAPFHIALRLLNLAQL